MFQIGPFNYKAIVPTGLMIYTSQGITFRNDQIPKTLPSHPEPRPETSGSGPADTGIQDLSVNVIR